MEYEDFKATFIADLGKELEKKGLDVNITEKTIEKPNESYESVSVGPKDGDVGVSVPIRAVFDAFKGGRPYGEVVDGVVKVIVENLSITSEFDVASISDYSLMRERLVIQAISTEKNAEFLETVPHRCIEDLAIIYRFVLSEDSEGIASAVVTNEMINAMNVTPEQLHADAVEVAPRNRPLEIRGISEAMIKRFPERAAAMGLENGPAEEVMYIASVPCKRQGAGVIGYPDFFEQVSEVVGGDFYVLPMNIDELAILPDWGGIDFCFLRRMVFEANVTVVLPEDRLTNSVYHYDAKEKIFELGEKYLARKAGQVA